MRLYLFVLALALCGKVFAHGDEDHSHDEPPAPVLAVPGVAGAVEVPQRLADGSVFVPKPVQRSLGILTTQAQSGEFPRVIELPGRVVADPNAGGRVQALQAGTVIAGPNGMATIGQTVQQGDVLALLIPRLDAFERAEKEATLTELAARAAQIEKQLNLFKQYGGGVPQQQIDQARIELEGAKARHRLLSAALDARQPLIAPVSGVVAVSHVGVGQVVEVKEDLFEIVDPKRLAIEALAFDPTQVARLGSATARIGSGGVIELDFIGAARSLREQALPLLFRIRADDAVEAPFVAVGQTLNVLVQTADNQSGVAVPASALGRSGGNDVVVWVHASAERFVPKRVKAEPLDAARMLVLEGLSGGEQVVTQGVQALGQIR